MKYELKVIQLYTEKQKDKTYKLSDYSKDDLIKLSKELRKAKHSSALIFASCFTFYSEIKVLMIAIGVWFLTILPIGNLSFHVKPKGCFSSF